MIILSTEFLNIQGNDSDAFSFQIFWHVTFPISRFIRISSTTFEEKGEKESGNERGRVEAEREGGRKFDLSAGMEEGGGEGWTGSSRDCALICVRYRPPLASVPSSSFSSRPIPPFLFPLLPRGRRIDKHRDATVHDSICRNKIKTAPSNSSSSFFLSLYFSSYIYKLSRANRGKFITNILFKCFEREKKRKRRKEKRRTIRFNTCFVLAN